MSRYRYAVAWRAAATPAPSRPGYFQINTWISQTLSRDQLDQRYPLPWRAVFWSDVWDHTYYGRSYFRRDLSDWIDSGPVVMVAVLLAWPWLSVAATAVFLFSMRRSRIRFVHLLRTVIYTADIWALTAVLWTAIQIADWIRGDGPILSAVTIMIAVVIGYRQSFAFGRYLHVHRPIATAAAIQTMTTLAVLTTLFALTADSGRWWR